MRTHRGTLALTLILAGICIPVGGALAERPTGGRTTVLVYDAERGIYLSEEIGTPRPLRDSVVLFEGTHRVERVPDRALRIGLGSAAARLNARLRAGEWLVMPGGALEYLLAQESVELSLGLVQDAPADAGGCFTTYVSRKGDIICASGCWDCYVVKVAP